MVRGREKKQTKQPTSQPTSFPPPAVLPHWPPCEEWKVCRLTRASSLLPPFLRHHNLPRMRLYKVTSCEAEAEARRASHFSAWRGAGNHSEVCYWSEAVGVHGGGNVAGRKLSASDLRLTNGIYCCRQMFEGWDVHNRCPFSYSFMPPRAV